ncbi:MAG: T9SS C-terminal target domain-containing protein, partial [Bacteroidetes bacterium]
IYPNPANDRVYLSLQNHTENFIYTLTDVTGKQVLNGISSGSTLSIDTSSLPGGLYILNIVGHSLNEYYKVVINH